MSHNNSRITVRLPAELLDKAKAEAARQERTLGWVIRRALERHLAGKRRG